MSTPDFLPQDDSNYNEVRFYTAQDVYYYTIDNRPLEDLDANLKSARSGGGDSARRAAAMLGLNLGALYSETITTGGRTSAVSGLQIVKTGNNSVRIMPGAYYETRSVSASVADSIVKQALMTKSIDFNIPSPVTGGTSIIYTIEGEFVELTQANAALSQLPYVDSNNKFLPSTYIHGELRLSLTVGSSATSGSEVPAVTTAGKFPIYNITLTQGSTNWKIQMHDNAPRAKALSRSVPFSPLVTNGATGSAVNEFPALNMAKGSIRGISLDSVFHENEVNPYLPIKVKIAFTPTMVGGEAAFRLRYKAFGSGELLTNGNNTSLDIVPIRVAANSVQVYTTTVSVKPWEFAGFVSNRWVVNKEFMNLIVERVSTDVADTNPGDIRILSTTLVQ